MLAKYTTMSYLVMNGIVQDMGAEMSEPTKVAKPRAKRAVKAAATSEPKVAKPRKSRAKKAEAVEASAETLPEDDGNVAMPELTREMSMFKLDPPSKPMVVPKALATDADAPEMSPTWSKFKAEVASGKYTPVNAKSGKPNLGKLAVQVSKMLTANPAYRPLVAAMLRDSPHAELCAVFGL